MASTRVMRGFEDGTPVDSIEPQSLPSEQPDSYGAEYDRNSVPNIQDEATDEKVSIDVDLNHTANKLNHKTKNYGIENLVIRRGLPMTMTIKINREFDIAKDRLIMTFTIGSNPQASKGTLVRVAFDKKEVDLTKIPSQDWVGIISSVKAASSRSEVTVQVRPGTDCPVGRYKLMVSYFRKVDGKEKKVSKKLEAEKDSVVIIFNAWCKDDQVYMESEEERFEYVLNESGRIFTNTWGRGRPWNFGQFSQWSLKAALECLELSNLDAKAYGNPTKVCRALSAMVNKCGWLDKGILVGNWSGNYAGGKSPVSWTGSPAILEQWLTTGRAVKYGQCWVFSGITTTLGRALGIPTRTVTNFDSAHDKDASMTIDTHFNHLMEPMREKDDSVWNFHVWNESHFTRPDLPEGYFGWQAYDATPQEPSGGEMQCGPAPVKAIKEGNVYMNYDAKFIYGEVNGDRLVWLKNEDESFTLIEVRDGSVGIQTATKAVGSHDRNRITYDYKYMKGTEAAKLARDRAYSFTNEKKLDEIMKVFKHTKQDVGFEYNGEMAPNGDIQVIIVVTNNSDSERNVKLRVSSSTAYYTGVAASRLSDDVLELKLKPGEVVKPYWFASAAAYWKMVDEDASLKLYLMAKVMETEQTFTKIQAFELDKPELEMKVSKDKPKVGEQFTLTISFVNPLGQYLTEGSIAIEGGGITKEKIITLKPIKDGEKVEQTVTLKSKYDGTREIIAVFHSKELVNIVGAVTVDVQA